MKIRVAPLPLTVKAFELWSFKPTPINFNELFMALKQGVVDGQDNGLDVTVPLKFTEVAKFLAFSNHTCGNYGWYISEKTWGKVGNKNQGIIEKEAKAAGDLLTRLSGQRQMDDLDTILKAGVKVTIPNRPAFREAVKDIYKEFEGKVWPQGLVEKIRAALKK
jgi:TRAP-type C4-dicarboxylate transport system substrate-binding protein